MRRLGHSRRLLRADRSAAATWAALVLLPAVLPGQEITRVGNRWVMTVAGAVPAASRLRVTSQGPVRVEGASGKDVSYTAELSVEARTQDDARRILSQNSMRVASNKGQVVLTTPGGAVTATSRPPAGTYRWARSVATCNAAPQAAISLSRMCVVKRSSKRRAVGWK